jgi:hypothetical protein
VERNHETYCKSNHTGAVLPVHTMKIFAKRKKVASPAASESKLFQSDKIVEELLQNDPSTWNAKQRRMIKRYQERVDEEDPNESTDDPKQDCDKPSNELEVKEKDSDDESEQEEPAQVPKQEEDEAAGTDDDDSSSDEAEEGNMPQNNSEDDMTGDAEAKVEPEAGITTQDPKAAEEKKESTDEPTNEELEKVLEKLNSKERRKLMRQLERGGNQEAVLEEARGKLQEKEPEVEENSKKRGAPGSSDGQSRASKRRNKNAVDWSKLPAEERMRREDQRRLQEEAVARRESGEKAPHKHPLNSERRRANRRKPKWAARVNRNAGNEHDTSGFHMRRDQKTSTAC